MYERVSVLYLSTYFMGEFHYNYIKRKKDAKLLFTDADSLVYKDFCKDKDLLDFSVYLQDSKFSDLVNKKIIGKTKHKFKGKIISDFVELKPKMYSWIDVDTEGRKKAKGVL